MKIRVYTENNSFETWPAFRSFGNALIYIKNNLEEFDSGDIVALVNYETRDCKFIRLKMEISEIN